MSQVDNKFSGVAGMPEVLPEHRAKPSTGAKNFEILFFDIITKFGVNFNIL